MSVIFCVTRSPTRLTAWSPPFFSICVNEFLESISNGEVHLFADDITAVVFGNSVDQVIQLLNVL